MPPWHSIEILILILSRSANMFWFELPVLPVALMHDHRFIDSSPSSIFCWSNEIRNQSVDSHFVSFLFCFFISRPDLDPATSLKTWSPGNSSSRFRTTTTATRSVMSTRPRTTQVLGSSRFLFCRLPGIHIKKLVM